MPDMREPDSRCTQTPARLVNLLGHHGHLTFFPTCFDDLRCWLIKLPTLKFVCLSGIICMAHLVQAVQTLKLSLAAVAIVRRMLFILVLLKSSLGLKNGLAVIARIPVLTLFVSSSEPPVVRGPAGPTPTTFDLIVVVGAIIQVVSHAVGSEGAATALRHLSFEGGIVSKCMI